MLTRTTERCQNKIFKNFLIGDFFYLPPVSTTMVVYLELKISPRSFEKIETVLIGYSGAWGKLINEKTEVENLVALSF
jgi:hypothetical protein